MTHTRTPVPLSFAGVMDRVGGSSTNVSAAHAWFGFGFNVIPVVRDTKIPAVKWDPWLGELSPTAVDTYWKEHPDHEVGFIVGDDLLVLDADSPESLAALKRIETSQGIVPNLVNTTRRGEHHFFRLADGVQARSKSFSTVAHPDRIDVKTGRSLVVLPPSTNKTVARCEISSKEDLIAVPQDFVDAIFRHNGVDPPREIVRTDFPSEGPISETDGQSLTRLRAMLNRIDPDCGYGDWFNGLAAVHNATAGSETGFQLVNDWSARGHKYCGERELRAKWRSLHGYTGTPITDRTLWMMLEQQGLDPIEVCAAAEPQFVPCDFEVLNQREHAPSDSEREQSADHSGLLPTETIPEGTETGEVTPELLLTAFSLTRNLKKLLRALIEQRYVFDGIALMGQATVLYAAPNTGKTLLVIWMLVQSIRRGWIDPSRVFYINCDDSLSGLLQKAEIAAAHGFHMVADGYEGFEIGNLRAILLLSIQRGQAKGVVLILDTLKKFTDLMDKKSATAFMKLIRKFVLQGGTVIMLAHANKNPGHDGKPVYAGTSDILDDADCGYTMWVSSEVGSAERVVEFERKKGRGDVRQRATFAYSGAEGLSYPQLFASVRQVGVSEASAKQEAAEQASDARQIEVVKDCIRNGIVMRMDLLRAITERLRCSRRRAEVLLDAHTGTDAQRGHWIFSVKARGAKVYRLSDTHEDSVAAASTPTTREAGHE